MTPEQYARLRGNLFLRLMTILGRLWQGLGTWHEPDVARFQRDALPVLQGAQRALGQLMAAYVAQSASAARGRQVPPPIIPVENLINVRKGVTVEDEYRRPFEQLWYGLSIGEDLPAATERGRIRLLGLADLDMQVTETQAASVAMQETEARWWKRVPRGEVNCLLCLMASTQRYWVGDLKALHPGCVPEGRLVSAHGIQAMTRRRYAGELSVLTTAAGDEVTVTPNHPVLTDRGWVPAGEVGPDDNLVRSGWEQGAVAGGPDEGQRPALIEDVWRSLSVAFDLVEVPLAAEDFHGDGSDGEVDVVRPDRDLASVWDPPVRQGVREGGLVAGHGWGIDLPGARNAAPLVERDIAGPGSGMGSGSLGRLLLGGHLGCPHAAGGGRSTALDLGVSQPSAHDGAGNAVLVGDDVLGESALEVVPAEFFDRVVDVRRVSFSGHVFNFQTRSGWYSSDSHIVHNCDCDIEPQFTKPPADRVIDETTLRSVYKTTRDQTGRSETAAEILRTLVAEMTDEHSEIPAPYLVTPRGNKRERARVTKRGGDE